MIAPYRSITEANLFSEVRDLFNEKPSIARRSPEAARRALRMLRGIDAPEFEIAAVLEVLRVEDEVLA